MDPAKQKQFSQWIWRRRAKLAFPFLAVSLLVVPYGGLFWFDPLDEGGLLPGTIKSLRHTYSERGQRVYWFVELENGHRVKVPWAGHPGFRVGRKVILQERVGRFFGRREYEFHDYAEGGDDDG